VHGFTVGIVAIGLSRLWRHEPFDRVMRRYEKSTPMPNVVVKPVVGSPATRIVIRAMPVHAPVPVTADRSYSVPPLPP
jgi:hypothetical protein